MNAAPEMSKSIAVEAQSPPSPGPCSCNPTEPAPKRVCPVHSVSGRLTAPTSELDGSPPTSVSPVDEFPKRAKRRRLYKRRPSGGRDRRRAANSRQTKYRKSSTGVRRQKGSRTGKRRAATR